MPASEPAVRGDDAEVVAVRHAGAYEQLTVVAPHIGARARPGQLAALLRDPETDAIGLPLPVWIAGAQPRGDYGATVELVVERGTLPGSERRTSGDGSAVVGSTLPLLGPLGRPIPAPAEPVRALLVGYEGATVPLLWHALELTARGCTVELRQLVSHASRHVPTLAVRRVCARVDAEVVTGEREGDVVASRVRERLVDAAAPVDLVVAAGPVDLVRDVCTAAAAAGATTQALLTPALPCATGLCGGCDQQVRLPDGRRRALRPCVHGPAVDGGLWPGAEVPGPVGPAGTTGQASGGPWLPGTRPPHDRDVADPAGVAT